MNTIVNTTQNKTTRFDTRLKIEQKRFFEKAAQLGGYHNLTEFIISTAMEKAKAIIAENERIIASERDSEIFCNAIMQQIEPNNALMAAAKEYKKQLAQ
jgi:uncharacterized protein (DUF1778 family)